MSISNAEYNLISAQWLEQFNRTIKQNPHDQFSALICDLESCESRQRELLHNLLFRNHNSARFWFEYCKFIVESFPQRKLQLQRLVNKAFNFINEVENRDDKHFVQLHLLSAKLKPCVVDSTIMHIDILSHSLISVLTQRYRYTAKIFSEHYREALNRRQICKCVPGVGWNWNASVGCWRCDRRSQKGRLLLHIHLLLLSNRCRSRVLS